MDSPVPAPRDADRSRRSLEQEIEYLREEVDAARFMGELIGRTPAVARLRRQIEVVASTDASVLIAGESGTGKELVAREIHRRSRRSAAPLVRINCAAVPRERLASTFFGHVRGAFNDAERDRPGRFEVAGGGTLFLDEVGEIPPELQAKLLRVLQEGEFEKLGDDTPRRIDVRVVAATRRPITVDVAEGRFRQDLYYRLNVFPIDVPPLCDRTDDIALLATHFIDLAAATLNLPRPRLTAANVSALTQYEWPGNVRELQNVIERAVITAQHGEMYFDLHGGGPTTPTAPSRTVPGVVMPEIEVRRLERQNLLAALEQTGWKIYGVNGAAELLGIKPNTLAARMKKLKLERPPSARGRG